MASTYKSLAPAYNGLHVWATLEHSPMHSGNTEVVFKAIMYNSAPCCYATKQRAIVRTKLNSRPSKGDWQAYLNCSKEAKIMAKLFSNKSNVHIRFTTPCIAEIDQTTRMSKVFQLGLRKIKQKHLKKNECVIIEEYLAGPVEEFVGESGKITSKQEILSSFSHFTYIESGKKFVICNLKGVCQVSEFKLTNPCIHSQNKTFGESDMGKIGIENFLKEHVCNRFCNQWVDSNTEINRQTALLPITEHAGCHVTPNTDWSGKNTTDSFNLLTVTYPFNMMPSMNYPPTAPPPYTQTEEAEYQEESLVATIPYI